MGKKGKGKTGDLGRALLRDRFGSSRSKRSSGESSMLHTADIEDGYKWDRLDLKSITEESSFQEFLSTAQLAGTEFHAEKLNIKFVNPQSGIGILSDKEKEDLLETHRQNKDVLKIPRRPKWDATTTALELQTKEKEIFLEWRRTLALVQKAQALTMTPYEKNLEFWRQLWRVVERSDLVVQIVDARNPLLFRCEDLEKYVKEVDSKKMNMILLNKADFLTSEQRQTWANYFTKVGMRVVFFSAKLSAEETLREQRLNGENKNVDSFEEENGSESEEYENSDTASEEETEEKYYDASEAVSSESEYENADDGTKNLSSSHSKGNENQITEKKNSLNEKSSEQMNSPNENKMERPSIGEAESKNLLNEDNVEIENSPELLNREKLISIFKSMYKGTTFTKGITTVGLVGYPNVGKSSTINAILMDKKVSVSATPGKTKHFQTLFVDEELLLCDCPGLVMPSFVCTKAEMILNGILPIDQLRDHVPAVTLVGTLIPRHIIEDIYGIMLPPPLEGEDPDRPPTAEEILNTYGYNRGFMTQNGQPDNPRSARYILKDFVNGKLLYCVAPPDQQQSEFHIFAPKRKITSSERIQPPRALRASRGVRTTGGDVDKLFFQSKTIGSHVRGGDARNYRPVNGSVMGSTQTLDLGDKPWKKINKHVNKKKREKSRRLYSYLDEH